MVTAAVNNAVSARYTAAGGLHGPATQKTKSKGVPARDNRSRRLDEDDVQVMSQQLHDVIAECTRRHPGAGAHEIAAYVARYAPVTQLRGFAAELLTGACRTVLNDQAHGSDVPRGAAGRRRRAPRPVLVPAKIQTPPSADASRSGWQALLDGTVYVGGSEQKALGACTVSDLQFCIKDRAGRIGRLEDQINHLRHLISLMQRMESDCVAELPLQKQWRTLA